MTDEPTGPVRSPWAAALSGAAGALSLPAFVLGFSLMGIAGVVRESGFSLALAVAATVLMFAGPAQVILFGGIASGAALPVVAIAVTLSSVRLLPMTMALMPLLRRPGQALWLQLLCAHYIAVTMWVEGTRRLPPMPQPERVPYFLGFANTCLVVGTVFTVIGYYLTGALPPHLAAAVLFLTPMFFTVSLVAGIRMPADVVAVVLGFALAPVFTFVFGKEFDLLATGLIGGTLAYLSGRIRWRLV
ncbi:MAG TPA: AzlC family ABC transporter permease [Beijerinckiaceae bacterium]|nr:AzlC family ABC transporter permease [Beijerinckiaceae bacterium]